MTNGTNKGQYFPTAPATRRRFAIVAWPKKDPGPKWRNMVWLVSGMQGYHASEQAVLDRCQADSGIECEVGKWDANGALVLVRDDLSQKGRRCAASAIYDAHTPRNLTIDIAEQAANGGVRAKKVP